MSYKYKIEVIFDSELDPPHFEYIKVGLLAAFSALEDKIVFFPSLESMCIDYKSIEANDV